MEEETELSKNDTSKVTKKPRLRKKLLYTTLRNQIEFYFSDINISKNRYMSNILNQFGYVDIPTLLTFNKIKFLTSKESDIVKALKMSEVLRVDGIQVYRVTPPQNVVVPDECSIYLERVPSDANHSWLSEIFEKFGPIAYISIPKHKHSRKNKGFAFIDFKDPESAKKALAAFSELNGCLSNHMNPSNLCSIQTFDENEDNTSQNENVSKDNKQMCNKTENNLKRLKEEKNARKRKHLSDTESSSSEASSKENKNKNNKGKKIKVESPEKGYSTDSSKKEDDSDNCSTSDGSSNKTRKSSKSDESSSNCDSQKTDNNESSSSEPLSLQKTLSKDIEDTRRTSTSETSCDEKTPRDTERDDSTDSSKKYDSDDCTSAVSSNKKRKLSKSDDSSNCDSQKTNCKNESPSSDKLSFQKTPSEGSEKEISGKSEEENIQVSEDNSGARKKNRKRKKKPKNKKLNSSHGLLILSKKEWKTLRNRYLNEQRQKMKELKQYIRSNRNYCETNKLDDNYSTTTADIDITEKDGAVRISDKLTLTKGLIVKLTMSTPIINKQSIKIETKQYPNIKYVDAKEGSNIVYLRFDSESAAKDHVNTGPWDNAVVIEGDEEKTYWQQIAKEREEKLNNKERKKVKKGKDKILKKVDDIRNKHIFFE